MTDVAVVGFAHAPHVRRTEGTTNGVEMLMPCFAELYEELGLKQTDIGFWCSGSSDYLAGRAFSFISAIDSIGAVPPINESHVEMDAAWALYEAYIKLLTGEVDTALVYGFGKSSAGTLRRVLALQTDPYTVAPLWPDSVSIAGLQARFGLDAGKWTAEQMAQVALDSFAVAQRTDSEKPAKSIDELLARPYFADPLRRHDIAPITDGAAADRAGRRRPRPRASGKPRVDHRFRAPHRDARAWRPRPHDLAVDGCVGQSGDRRRGRLDRRGRDLRAIHPPTADPERGHRAGRVDQRKPFGRGAWRPIRCSRRAWSASASPRNTSSTDRRSACWPTPPAGLRCNRISSRSWRER